ncbi:hypothetical protein BD408DRAFT_426337 [Parasitella parasitica]|nr:hypothetical protein BD408DRAFT_426337 [Parasitella parasitica]
MPNSTTSKSNSVAVVPEIATASASSYSHEQNRAKSCLICGSSVHMTRNCPVSA